MVTGNSLLGRKSPRTMMPSHGLKVLHRPTRDSTEAICWYLDPSVRGLCICFSLEIFGLTFLSWFWGLFGLGFGTVDLT